MSTVSMLYKDFVPINDNIGVAIPTLREILNNESEYYSLLSIFTAMPIDMMVQLDDVGIDFAKINEYELFLLLLNSLQTEDTHLILGDLNLSGFQPAISNINGDVILYNNQTGVVIDREIHNRIASILRKIHNLEKNNKKPANGEAKAYMIRRAREKMRRNKSKPSNSHLEGLIVALVNTEQFSYKFDDVLDLTIYQFNSSVRQIIKKTDYDNRMYGVYSGTVSAKDLSQDDLNWLTHK